MILGNSFIGNMDNAYIDGILDGGYFNPAVAGVL
jgi:hypothetical protein